MNQTQIRLLKKLLEIPTAPFKEMQIQQFAQQYLQNRGVPWFTDTHGNVVVGVNSVQAYKALIRRRTEEPVRIFIAHMDHPGFHGKRWLSSRRLQVEWHGGSPVKHCNGARVWLSAGAGYCGHGLLRKVELIPSRRAIARAEVQMDSDQCKQACLRASQLYGGLAFRSPVWQQGQRIYTKAADDLVGVFCILETARQLYRKATADQPFIGLLTRGEEVGFVGAVAHLQSGWLKSHRRPLVAVSLEASRTLPGALVGKGPVVRLGDRRTIFDANGMQVLSNLAMRLLKDKHQRRIMDGGACEATAATAWGLPTIALSVPLGNYHNQGYEGGPDCKKPEGPAPEFVHLDDIHGQLKLCIGLMQKGLPWADPWEDVRKRLSKNKGKYRKLL